MSVSPDAVLSVGAAITLALAGALWKLATMLAEVRSEVRHNGGGSLKDNIHRIGAAVEQIKTSLTENAEHLRTLDSRVTDHRRRNDAAALALREHLDKKLAEVVEGQIRSDGLQAVLHELGIQERHDERGGHGPDQPSV